MIDLAPEVEELRPRIKVIGIGGAGGNAVANMIGSDVQGVDFIVANTDGQALRASPAACAIQLGRITTQGLGAGSVAEIGRAAAEESIAEIEEMLEGADMCFIAAGLGGGTGTGAAPVVARAARARGILTVAVVTKPFDFEGGRRARAAEAGLDALQREVDTLIVIPNQNLFRIAGPATTIRAAFGLADDVLQQGVRGITDLMLMPGLINLDFADVRTIMIGMGKAMMGTAEASGDDRAIRAAQAALANPLLDEAIRGAKGVIISITGSEDMRLMEVDEAASHIKALVDPDADIIWGSAFNPALEGRIRVSVVATGIDSAKALPARAAVAAQEAPIAAPTSVASVLIAALGTPVQQSLDLDPALQQFLGAAPLPIDGAKASSAPPIERADDALPPAGAPILLLTALADTAPVPVADALPARGPSLFQRVAMAARAGRTRDASSASPPDFLYDWDRDSDAALAATAFQALGVLHRGFGTNEVPLAALAGCGGPGHPAFGPAL